MSGGGGVVFLSVFFKEGIGIRRSDEKEMGMDDGCIPNSIPYTSSRSDDAAIERFGRGDQPVFALR